MSRFRSVIVVNIKKDVFIEHVKEHWRNLNELQAQEERDTVTNQNLTGC